MDITYTPQFQRSARLVRYLTESERIIAWIGQQMVDVSWIGRSQRDALVRMAHYSTRIEGNPLTLPEVEALAAGKDLAVEERAKQEVLNYFSALRWIWKFSSTDIKEKDLLKLHGILTAELLPKEEVGAYKLKANAVFGNGKIIYKPPPPEVSGPLTRALLHWIHSAGEEHPVIIAAVAHHRLVSIHPFMDGNGRIARALESWLLFRRGFDTHHILALDEFFDQDRPRYYREIQNVREHQDNLTSWLEYVAEGINETLHKAQVRIQSLRIKGSAGKIVLIPKQERILQILAQAPRIGGGELAKSLGVTRSHLSKMIRPMIQAGLVNKEGTTRSASYRLP